MKKLSKIEKHLFLSDFQIPEHDERSINAVLKFITDFRPDVVHLVGDILDLTKLSKYDQDAYNKITFKDEIEIGRKVITELVEVVRKANKNARINFYIGNHEQRFLHYLSRKASEIADVEDADGYVFSLPRLLEFKKHNIKLIPYFKSHVERGNVVVEHGDIARSKAGYTAHAMLDKRGSSGVSGHTHRLALIFKTQGNTERFWIENGSLCKRNFKNPYLKNPDWITGFSVGIYIDGIMHPTIIPIFNYKFVYGDKLYRG